MQLKSVVLYLQHDFDNIIFKIEHKIYIASGLGPPPPQWEILGGHLTESNDPLITVLLSGWCMYK
jgi:hypothetical protein